MLLIQGFIRLIGKRWGQQVTAACLDCLNNCYLPIRLNETNIVPIPKVKKPSRITDLWPILLCNIVVKIMTKVLANRLKEVLESIISDSQSAFIPGRLITDNVMIAFEIGHYLKRKMQGKVGLASLKIDMSKVYDRVEWVFLERMMLKLGIAQRWVKLVMLFDSSVKYMVINNGFSVGPILPGRGLRQGDPISPYIFLICAEGLSSILNYHVCHGRIHGCKVANSAPVISHLFFADNNFLFFRAT